MNDGLAEQLLIAFNNVRFKLSKESEASLTEWPKCNAGENKCLEGSCPRKSYASGYCNVHYIRKRKGTPMDQPIQRRGRSQDCRICGKSLKGKGGYGYCLKHYQQARRKYLKEAAIELMGGCCRKCKNIFPICAYDFHHLDKTTKEESPGILFNTVSFEKIAAEISKCILLCANCHRIEHNENK